MTSNDSIQLLDYLRAVRQRWRLVALVVFVTTVVALVVSISSDKQYDASAELLLRDREPVNTLLDPGATSSSSDPERELNTEVQLITVAANAHAVQRELNLRRSPDDLIAQVETDTSSTSNIVTLKVRDPNPLLAARIANAFASAYVEFRLQSARQRYRQAADLARQQLLALSPGDRRTAQGRELQARQRELEIAAALQTGGAEIVRRASVPTSPSRPRPKLSAALGLFLGLVLGVGAALVLNLLDRRFKDERDIETFFDLPILAAIPRPARRGGVADDPAQREAYGLLAANVRLSTSGKRISVLMVTSPSPGEGKTSVTVGLAQAFARLGLRVVAIEADLRRPAFSRYADVTVSSGLSGVLGGDVLAGELIWLDPAQLGLGHDPDGGVGLLPAGALPDNPQRVLAGSGLGHVIHAARAMADIVLVDTAPVGTVNDAAVVARHVEGVALVARLNQTTKDAGRRTNRTLSNLAADVLGVVVTDAGGSERHTYYAPLPERVAGRARSGVQGGVD